MVAAKIMISRHQCISDDTGIRFQNMCGLGDIKRVETKCFVFICKQIGNKILEKEMIPCWERLKRLLHVSIFVVCKMGSSIKIDN